MTLRQLLICVLCFSSPLLMARSPEDKDASMRLEASTKDPRSRAKIHTELGSLYYQEGQIATAMEELTIAIAIDPSYAPAYAMRALVHNYLKEPQYAEENFQQAFRLSPDDPELANNYGWFLCENGRPKEGLSSLLRALNNPLYPTPERAYLNAGQCAITLGDTQAAAGYLEKAYRFSGGSAIAALRLADLSYHQGNFDKARQQLNELLIKTEPNAEALWLALRIERKLGNTVAERKYASQLHRKFPKSKEYEALLKEKYE